MRTYKGISLNHLNPKDPGFESALRSDLNEVNLFLQSVQRELSPLQAGSTTAVGAANTEPYVCATATSGLVNERRLTGTSPIGVSDGGAGGNISVTLSGIVPVANGGTGQSALFDSTVPSDLGTAAAGSSLFPSHADHIHARPRLVTVLGVPTTSTTVADTTSDTNLSSGVSVVANSLSVGSHIRWMDSGYISTDAIATTLEMKLVFGTGPTTLATTGAVTVSPGVTTRGWRMVVDATVRSVGGSGTLFVQGFFAYHSLASTHIQWEMVTTATVTYDTTASQTWRARAQWGTADPDNALVRTNETAELFDPA